MTAHVSYLRTLVATAGVLVAVGLLVPAAFAAAPVLTSPPTITGLPQQGQTLTAQNGTWENSPTAYQYQWRRCDASGGSCVNIRGNAQKTHNVVGADVGHRLRVRVTAVNADGATNAESAPTAVVTSTAAPKNTERPTISGTARVGQTLTADTGSWSGSPDSFAYQWQRSDADGSTCGNIAGSTEGPTSCGSPTSASDCASRRRRGNTEGTGMATSGVSRIVAPAVAITNVRPTLRIVSVRFPELVSTPASGSVRLEQEPSRSSRPIAPASLPTRGASRR